MAWLHADCRLIEASKVCGDTLASHVGPQGQEKLTGGKPETPLWKLARVAKAEHRMEACLQRGKSEAGLADYEVRNWAGWQLHHTLSLLATWFLVRETEREKNGPLRSPCRRFVKALP